MCLILIALKLRLFQNVKLKIHTGVIGLKCAVLVSQLVKRMMIVLLVKFVKQMLWVPVQVNLLII